MGFYSMIREAYLVLRHPLLRPGTNIDPSYHAQRAPARVGPIVAAGLAAPLAPPTARRTKRGLEERAPEVSIGLPVYNGERYVASALDSLLAQTHEDLEVVVCDNASTDGTEEIVRAYAAQDSRIRYHRNPVNIGAAANFNRVFELSRAPYFKWHTADDLCDPTLVERCLATLKENPDAIVAFPRARLIDAEGAFLRDYDDALDLRSPDPVERFRAVVTSLGLCNLHYGVVRADLLRRTHLMGGYVAADVVMIAEMSLHGTFCEVPERLLERRFHEAASSAIRGDGELQAFWNPKASGVPRRCWRHLWGHCQSALRARLPIRHTWRLLWHIVRMAAWSRRDLWRELRGTRARSQSDQSTSFLQ